MSLGDVSFTSSLIEMNRLMILEQKGLIVHREMIL